MNPHPIRIPDGCTLVAILGDGTVVLSCDDCAAALQPGDDERKAQFCGLRECPRCLAHRLAAEERPFGDAA